MNREKEINKIIKINGNPIPAADATIYMVGFAVVNKYLGQAKKADKTERR